MRINIQYELLQLGMIIKTDVSGKKYHSLLQEILWQIFNYVGGRQYYDNMTGSRFSYKCKSCQNYK